MKTRIFSVVISILLINSTFFVLFYYCEISFHVLNSLFSFLLFSSFFFKEKVNLKIMHHLCMQHNIAI